MPVLRRLCTWSVAVVGGTVRLAVGEYALGEGASLRLKTKGMRPLGEEGVVITRAVNGGSTRCTLGPRAW